MNIYTCAKDILSLEMFEENWLSGTSQLQHDVTLVGSCIATVILCLLIQLNYIELQPSVSIWVWVVWLLIAWLLHWFSWAEVAAKKIFFLSWDPVCSQEHWHYFSLNITKGRSLCHQYNILKSSRLDIYITRSSVAIILASSIFTVFNGT